MTPIGTATPTPIATAWFEEDDAAIAAALVVAAAAVADIPLAALFVLWLEGELLEVDAAKLDVTLVVGASIIVSAVAGPSPAIFVVLQHPI